MTIEHTEALDSTASKTFVGQELIVERPEAFDFFGPKTLIGPELTVGETAPDFILLNAKLKPVNKNDLTGKPIVISVVPSLETDICHKQTVRFNEEAVALSDRVHFVTVSADLPFAQRRWCKANEVQAVQVLSDHRDMSFGNAYGTHIKELRFESRAAFVVDAAGIIQYAEYLPTAGQEPDYEAVLKVLQQLLG